jgi:4-alpha-glucanotransferase
MASAASAVWQSDESGTRADSWLVWWVPAGMPPDRGAYVSYDHRLTVGALVAAAARADAPAIGEGLGTVDPWIRRYLARQHVLGTEMAWFAREPDGPPLLPPHGRRGGMATVGTHDVPTDLRLRHRRSGQRARSAGVAERSRGRTQGIGAQVVGLAGTCS